MTKPEPVISPIASIVIMLTTVFSVLATGAIAAVFSTSYESNCTPDTTGKSVCTQTIKFQGWAGIPLQPLAGAIGTGIGIYAAVKSGKLPGMRSNNEEEPSGDVPS
ncbi:hypothetical protein [Chroococcidiopsis sp.]|uniref:hypothetical protein n=1 Tax=Chroococcidiopsis sp. TaxID=3088168 RepID=UPI003F2E1EB8